jgi:integrase
LLVVAERQVVVSWKSDRPTAETLTALRIGRKLARMSSTRKASNHTPAAKPNSDPLQALIEEALSSPDDVIIATGAQARSMSADLVELRRLRAKVAGGSVFKRPRSPYWQIKYLVDGKWRYETTLTRDRREAENLRAFKVYEASAGLLPGTATFEKVIEHFLRDAKVRGLRSVPRLERATKPLLKRLEGCRAEQIDSARWLKYLDERQQEAAPDTVHLELSIARRAYRVARSAGLVKAIPDIPRVPHLRVRKGFIEPRDWARVREHLRPEFRDACDFAVACGAREMEVLSLQWSDIEPDGQVIHLRATKTDSPRKVPYAKSPQLGGVIERRSDARRKRERAGVISPFVFCFDEPVKIHGRVYHVSGAPLFLTRKRGDCSLLPMLRSNLAAACASAALPQLLFHDFRRSAARNFERAGAPRSVARMIGGWSNRIYDRYAIGDESELGTALAQVGDYLHQRGWHSVGTRENSSIKSRKLLAEGGGSRTLRQPQ